MTGDDLIAEGQRLAKACVYLETLPLPEAKVAAFWGGNGVVAAPDGPYRHWLSVEGDVLPADVGTEPGVLSLYTNEEDDLTGLVVFSSFASLRAEETDGIKLYARPALSLPPIDAVFKFGSSDVHDWLAENNWLPADGGEEADYAYNDNFPDKAIVDVYESVWQAQLPLFTGGAHAVLGGWHLPWPDGDWYDLVEKTLVAWTFEDAEPWVEVWRDTNRSYKVVQRST